MAKPWKSSVRSAGRLLVYNDAGAWSRAVDNAISTFNGFALQVTLETTTEESDANVVVKLTHGNTGSYTYRDRFYGEVPITATFDASRAHGKTKPLVDPDRGIIVFAAVFLPERLDARASAVREVVSVHEFIHAAGMDSDDDHDHREGVFYSPMEVSGATITEWGMGHPPMPPVRIGPNTVCRVNALWADNVTCD